MRKWLRIDGMTPLACKEKQEAQKKLLSSAPPHKIRRAHLGQKFDRYRPIVNVEL
jgi:hypothetical protein